MSECVNPRLHLDNKRHRRNRQTPLLPPSPPVYNLGYPVDISLCACDSNFLKENENIF
jgi:hypothetical protein